MTRRSRWVLAPCFFALCLLTGGCNSGNEGGETSAAEALRGIVQPARNVSAPADTATSWVYPRDDQMNIRLATVYGRADLVRERIAEGVSPDEAYEESGETPLMIAARMGHRCLASDLLDAGADPNATDDGGSTPLMRAAAAGHAAVVNRLLDAGANPGTTTDDNGTALFRATVGEAKPEIVDALLAAGADPNVETANGWTPLRSAEHEGHEQVVVRLREAGAREQ